MKSKLFFPKLYNNLKIVQDAVNNTDGGTGHLPGQRRASNIIKNIAKLETPTPPESQFRVPQHQSVILSYSKQGQYHDQHPIN